MRILLLSRYGRLGASSRVRMYQYQPYLETAGIHITAAPLFDDGYVQTLYSGGGSRIRSLLTAPITRLLRLRELGEYDLLWVEYELLPWLPATVERVLNLTGRKYVVEFDDAIFHRYDRHSSSLVRLVLGRKIDRIMRWAAAVIAGNAYLAARAVAAGARRVEQLPSVVDLERYGVSESPRKPSFTIGWIGSPATVRYLEAIVPSLRQVCADGDACIRLVGAPPTLGWPAVNVEHRPWSEEREVAEIQDFDVGIMPLADGPWERGKCGYKLVQYMACGKPVVASPVGANTDLVTSGVTGLLATTIREWTEALRGLRADAGWCRTLGRNGRRLVEQRYCVQVTAPRLVSLLRELASSGR